MTLSSYQQQTQANKATCDDLFDRAKHRYLTDAEFHALVDLSISVMNHMVQEDAGRRMSRSEQMLARYTTSIALLLKEKQDAQRAEREAG